MTAGSFELWAPLVVTAIITWLITPIAIYIAPKIGAVDIPKDKRRVHNKPMPRFGGMAIYIGMMAGLAFFALEDRGIFPAMVGCTLIYILGVVDDIKGMKPIIKFAGQLVCATVVFAMGLRIQFITNYFSDGNMNLGLAACYLLTVLWIAGITNAVNLVDGLDGLAAGIAGISALCIAYVSYIHGQYIPTIGMMVVAGSCIGFLPFNFHPAKTFMGDSGSQLLGFAIASLSILGTVKSATMVVVVIPALVLGLPIFDTMLAIVRRTLRGQSIGTADKEHLHHRILRAGFGQRRAVMLMYALSGIMGVVAILYSRGLIIECIALAIVAIIILGVILTDTGTNKVSLKGYRILKEIPDAPRNDRDTEQK
ncbi:MAG: undecaprenyl/decaprenyl-phosphate alpha-N-acetylglucosaminyl 1-phosphate transferase [Firmicutes bacterium]|nr:undecaprenyl/decaprenyl-phosphate alpha-N-acetylglucosaminyl 1-phosphate transferase [Bacillota bacterium]